MKKYLLILFVPFLVMACKTSKMYVYDAEVTLASVRIPDGSYDSLTIKQGSGNSVSGYQFDQKDFSIIWNVSGSYFNFELQNLSTNTITISWDMVAFVDYDGLTSGVIHEGVPYANRAQALAPTVVPKGAFAKDYIIPVNKIENNQSEYGNWMVANLFPTESSKYKEAKKKYVGKTFRIFFPLLINGENHEYTFVFDIDDVLMKRAPK